MRKLLLAVVVLFAPAALAGVTKDVITVEGFELNRYLGKWYEIARLDHRFERGMSHVTAQYSLREDGKVRVINRGYLADKKTWKQSEGRAKFVDKPTTGRLKVTFFWLFYGSYNIVVLDKQHYQYALVTGGSRDYLWILSRTPKMSPDVLHKLLARAKAMGFDTENLIWVAHGGAPT